MPPASVSHKSTSADNCSIPISKLQLPPTQKSKYTLAALDGEYPMSFVTFMKVYFTTKPPHTQYGVNSGQVYIMPALPAGIIKTCVMPFLINQQPMHQFSRSFPLK